MEWVLILGGGSGGGVWWRGEGGDESGDDVVGIVEVALLEVGHVGEFCLFFSCLLSSSSASFSG